MDIFLGLFAEEPGYSGCSSVVSELDNILLTKISKIVKSHAASLTKGSNFFLGKITLRDLKRCKLSHIFFDTFFNIEKYLDHEQRDPLLAARVMNSRLFISLYC